VLFVLTSVWPESVIGMDFGDIFEVFLNNGMEVPGPPNAIILKLKKIDPYLANSSVRCRRRRWS